MPFVTLTRRLKLRLNAPIIFSLFKLLSRLFKSLISRAFSLISLLPSMDDLFDINDDDFLAVDSSSAADFDADDDDLLFPHSRRRRRLCSSPFAASSLSLRHDRLFFVPYRWWKDASEDCLGGKARKGVVYTALSDDKERDLTSEIVLYLKRETRGDDDVHHEEGVDDKGEGVSGREYALISESMWFKALKWHSDYCTPIKDIGCSLAAEDKKQDVFPIQIRLSVMQQTSSLMVKIRQMDNPFLLYGRACQVFNLQSDLLRIWDFSGQITEFFEGNHAVDTNRCLSQVDEEILLELQVYGLPDFGKDMEVMKGENVMEERSNTLGSFDSCSYKMNGAIENESSSPLVNLRSCARGNGKTSVLGLTGLLNLGNTCFMNSAIQCLAHTPRLVDYFLGDFRKEINYENPLGMNGELALAFGDLLRKLWFPGNMPIAPRLFKSTLDSFAPQFSGYNQHDSQEFLAFLLDGLHEDLNRVKHKPYMEVRDAEGRPDEAVAVEYWQNHLARNDSIIVDLFHGQYRSTLVCPICKRVSFTFDPFMYLSLPLPSAMMRSMTLTMLSSDGSNPPSSLTVTVPKFGRCKDLVHALRVACSLRDDETLLVAEVFNHCILHFLEDPSGSLELIRDDDCLVAYRLPKGNEASRLVVFLHQRAGRHVYGMARSCWRLFGIPLVARICDLSDGSQIHNEYVKLLRPFSKIDGHDYDDNENSDNELAKMEEASTSNSDDSLSAYDETGDLSHSSFDFQCHFTSERGTIKYSRIKCGKPLDVSTATKELHVLVSWSELMVRCYDIDHLNSLPEKLKPGFPVSRPQELVTLYKCLEGFLKEEPLGPEDMWYCPSCKTHRQASKKLDLWRLPEVLVVHLKRFSYSRFLRNKLETYVDFPIENLDLSGFLAHENGSCSNRYRLYAISNHYGGMGGGHYTAMVYHGKRWYEFSDSTVETVGVDDVKTSAAYVLFYRRVLDT